MALVQRFAQVFGAIYVLVGILGFVAVSPILTQAPIIGEGGGHTFMGPVAGYLLGLFAVNWLHDIAHLAIGAVGLAVYRNPAAASTYALALGVVYALLFLLGLILPTVFGLLPLFGAPDLILHLVTALIAFGAFFSARTEAGRATT